MQLIGLARLGRDAELRHLPSGEAVANFSVAFNYGRKDQSGNRPTQWIDCALWGKRAESLIDYLVKGQQVVLTLDDPHIEEYQGRNGTGYKLAATVSGLEFAGGKPDSSQQGGQQRSAAPAPAPRPPAQPPAAAPSPSGGFSDMDDDIPF